MESVLFTMNLLSAYDISESSKVTGKYHDDIEHLNTVSIATY